MRDPLDPRPDVHDFNACLARSQASLAVAREHGQALFEQGEDSAEAASEALGRALEALIEARAALSVAAIRRLLLEGFGDIAALDCDELRRQLVATDARDLLVHVDRQAQLRVGAGPKSWTLSRDMSNAALEEVVGEIREHLPDFLREL